MNTERKVKPVFSNKAYPISVEMRPLWRICLILIAIIIVSGSKKYLTIKKVNILVWMLIRRKKWDEYEEYLYDRTFDIPLVSVDTATYKAVEFSIAKELVTLENERLYITGHGEELFSLIEDNDIMSEEMRFIRQVGKKLTAKKVKGLTGGKS